MIKKFRKQQQLKLPLIGQSLNNSISKSSTKKTQLNKNLSLNHLNDKQKNFLKLNKIIQIQDKRINLHNKSLNHKSSTKATNALSDKESEFQEKIKQNRILLKKSKEKNQIEKKSPLVSQKKIGKKLKKNMQKKDYTNKLKYLSSKNEINENKNKSLISLLVNSNSNQWAQNIMKGFNPKKSYYNKKYYHKRSRSNVFENIHRPLQNLQYDFKFQVKFNQKFHRKLQKYKQKLQIIEPDSQFLRRMDRKTQKPTLQQKQNHQQQQIQKFDNQKTSKNSKIRYMTATQWSKVTSKKQKFNFLQESFEKQIQKINLYLSKSNNNLEQLLKNKIFIIDLVFNKKFKLQNSLVMLDTLKGQLALQ